MKKNIVFAGAMAVILGVGGASAATTEIASKQYVDTQLGEVSSDVSDLQGMLEGILKEGQIDGGELKDGTVSGEALVDGTVSGDKLEDESVTGDKLEDATVTGDKIASETITGENIKDGSIEEKDLNTALKTKIDGKQDKNMGKDNANKIVTTDADGNITALSKLTIQQIEDLSDKLETAVGDGANSMKNELEALKTKVGSGELSDEDASDIIDAINKMYARLDASLNEDGKIDGEQLADKSVDTGALADGAVTEDKIDDGAVTEEKIGEGAVTEDKIGEGAVTGDKLGEDLENLLTVANGECNAESGLCVLSLDKSGNVSWVNVTQPAE